MGRFRGLAKVSTRGRPATPAQLDYLTQLGGDSYEGMTAAEASEEIEQCKGLRDDIEYADAPFDPWGRP